MPETCNDAVSHGPRSGRGRSSKRQRRGLYQRGVKPHDKGHFHITFSNPRAESPDYRRKTFRRRSIGRETWLLGKRRRLRANGQEPQAWKTKREGNL